MTLLITKEIFSLAQELEFSVFQNENFLIQLSVIVNLMVPMFTNLQLVKINHVKYCNSVILDGMWLMMSSSLLPSIHSQEREWENVIMFLEQG